MDSVSGQFVDGSNLTTNGRVLRGASLLLARLDMDARLAEFLDMDWDERIDLLKSLASNAARKTYMQKIAKLAEIQSNMLETHEAEDLHDFVLWLVS